MKIIEFRQESTCYVSKNRKSKIDRSDIWEKSEDGSESIWDYYHTYVAHGEENSQKDETVHVVYLFGQGGIGKSFVCQEMKEKLAELSDKEAQCVISLDLQRQASFEDNLKCLADEISEQLGKKDLFPRFKLAYYNYKLKKGEDCEREERSTKWDELHENSTFGLVSGAAGFLSSFGTISDVIDIANDGYKWILQMRDNVQYKAVARQIEEMDEKELRGELVRYFATDFAELNDPESKGLRKKHNRKKTFVFLLDTVESMRYQTLRSGTGEDYLDWLVGSFGLLRLLPDCFWIMFGREEISWKKYDEEWQKSFLSREFTKPAESEVKKYLLKQLEVQAKDGAASREDGELDALTEEMVRLTECYPLAVENCVDVYYRIWNENLRKNKVTDESLINNYRPRQKDICDLFLDNKGKKIISNRFMQYYTLQEREVLYTLVCLGTWTDDILEDLIWKGSISNRLIYEEMCQTSFVQVNNRGQKTIRGLMLETIMEECPSKLKKQLFHSILKQMRDRDIDVSYWLLYESAVHIAGFLACDEAERDLLGTEFVKAVEFCKKYVRMADLLHVCEKLLETADKLKTSADRDIYNAARVGRYFALVFQKKDASEELHTLWEQESFGVFSYQVWKSLIETAEEIRTFQQAYEVTSLLTEKFSAWEEENFGNYHWLFRKKIQFMQKLTQPEQEKIKEEITRLCEMTGKLASAKNGNAQKLNAELWAEYYNGLPDAKTDEEGMERAGEIQNCIEEYKSYCTEEEKEQDVTLCRMELMSMWAPKAKDLVPITKKALHGLRILENTYGNDAWKRWEAENFALQLIILSAEYLEKEELELCQRVFEAYYRDFCKTGNLKSYHVVERLCFWVSLKGGDEEISEFSGTIRQGILYLTGLRSSSMREQMCLLVSYSLLNKLGENVPSCMDRNLTGDLLIKKESTNNLMLISLLQQEAKAVCEKKKEISPGPLQTYLKVIFDPGVLGSHVSEEEKRQLVGLLGWFGIETEHAQWKAEYEGDTKGDEFKILSMFNGWEWKCDTAADAKMTDLVLYLTWMLYKDADSMEGKILETVEKTFSDENDRAAFWLALRADAVNYGEEWKAHADVLFKNKLDKWYDYSKWLTENTKRKLGKYDARFEELLPEKNIHGKQLSQRKVFENKVRKLLKEGDYDGAKEIMMPIVEEFRQSNGRSVSAEYVVTFFFASVVRNRGTEHFVEETEQLKFSDKCNWVLRAYAYLEDKEGFADYYWKNRQEIWDKLPYSTWDDEEELYERLQFVLTIDDTALTEDFLKQMCRYFEKTNYVDGVIGHLPLITTWLPFEDIWNRALCIKEIKACNCDKVYQSLKAYLSREELQDIFLAAAPIEPLLKDRAPLAFFESEYYAWMKETFGDASDTMLSRKFPELYKAEEAYKKWIKDDYLWQMNKRINEIRDCIQLPKE